MEIVERGERPGGALRLRPRRSVTRPFAWLVSLAVHVVLLALLVAQASGELMATDSGGDAQPGFQVMLVRPAREAAAASTTERGALRLLLAKHGADTAPVYLPPEPPADPMRKLLARLQTAAPADAATERDTASTSSSPADGPDRPDPPQTAQAGAGPGVASSAAPGSTGSLWGAVAPCWRPPEGAQRPVTLEVTLDRTGRIARPPAILRPSIHRLDDMRLRAEAQALAALGACLADGDLRFANATYRLDFPAQASRGR